MTDLKMIDVTQSERLTQNRIVKLFREQLGYTYLGNWEDRPNNTNIEEKQLRQYLIEKAGYPPEIATRAIYLFQKEARSNDRNLYGNNKKVYEMLRYGVEVAAPGEKYQTVHLINWDKEQRHQNEFAIAEEVTLLGHREKRPDIVLYINGIAVGVLELKNSRVSIGDGIRQSIVNQQEEFIQSFFSTMQFIMAGNDTEGLRYGTIGTEEKFYLSWKEDIEDNSLLKIDKYLLKICNKERLLELMYDFVLFDGGKKKLPRPHQYFGIKDAQDFVRRREGGIIWHTQGSGKSIVMVLLAKWVLENNPHARVVILTDRDELDKQIERVFVDAGEEVKRTSSGGDLMYQLGQPTPRLICSLIHKFGKKKVEHFEKYIEELKQGPKMTIGELFVFVDECHRTQSGKLHKTMKAILDKGVFIGFTGTPLLKKDKATSLEVFGKYIHTYKFNEAVDDDVVLDLLYEARDIDQRINNPKKVDEWFEYSTNDLNEFQKSELKKKWGTMQKVLSSKNRMEKIVMDIQLDFRKKPRLSSHYGNAILVAGSIYEACKFFELFQQTEFKNRCAVVTSYNPATKDITTEDTGANTETEKEYIYKIYTALLKDITPATGKTKTETYEDLAKDKFLKLPAEMRLLIVVDKLLTGFDAPKCTYLYIDKSMQDHGLFQAICRVNRLDTDDKEFGYIVDYKDLFKKVENAVAVYTSELDYDQFKKEDCDILLKDRLKNAKERLDTTLEALELLCEPVPSPKSMLEYQHYFCGNSEIPEELKATEVKRMGLYKATVAFIRAYANIGDEMTEAGYSEKEKDRIENRMDFYFKLREVIRKASGEYLDTKPYEADMRFLIDHYIVAEDPEVISYFSEFSLIDLIVNTGIAAAINTMPPGIRDNRDAVAETIENNVRRKIIKDHLIDPAFFEEMSTLLDEVIKQRRSNAINYEEYLKEIAKIAAEVKAGGIGITPPAIQTAAQKALYNNLGKNEELAIAIHAKVMAVKPDNWRDNGGPRELSIMAALFEILNDEEEVRRVFNIIKQQKEY